MFKGLNLNKVFQKTSANGVEIVIQQDGTYIFNFACLKKEKSSLVTEKQKSGIKNIEDLKNEIDNKLPLVLIVNGKGIINKKVVFKESDTVKTFLNKVLPNANESEFCIQTTLIDDSTSFVSVIRTNILNDILNLFNSNKLINISACFIGPFALNNCLEFIGKENFTNDKLQLLNYQFEIHENLIREINSIEDGSSAEEINVGNEKISSETVISFAGAFSYFINAAQGVLNSTILDDAVSNYGEKRKFEIRSWSLLISIFIILMVNFLLFSNYWNKNNEIASRLEMNKASLNKVDTLKKELSQKKIFLEQNGLLENSMTSFYADKLASGLPNSISWTNLDIHPAKKKEANDESELMYFENKIIRVTGNCLQSTDLNDWMKKVKQNSWVADARLLNYQQNNAKENGSFLLEIILK